MAEDAVPVVAMGVLFVVALLLALAIFPQYQSSDVRAFEDESDPTNIVFFAGVILVFTAVILALARYGLESVIRYIILFAVGMTIIYAVWPILSLVGPPLFAFAGSLAVAGTLAVLLAKYPEWYVVDAAGVLMAAGAAALFGVSLIPALVVLLLVGMAVYDALAVYRTKHMVSLADTALTEHLPIMLVIPKTWGYSFLAEGGVEEQVERGEERQAMFMGLGDVVVPGILVVSAASFAPASVGSVGPDSPIALGFMVLAGAIGGLAGLMLMLQRGEEAHAGLPLLNGGAILGYAIGLWTLYGDLSPLIPF